MAMRDWPASPEMEAVSVGEVLMEHEESRILVEALSIRFLTPGQTVIIWGLRAYVVFMAVVVAVNVSHTLH